ncbi:MULTISPECIES: hypothetical protein [unclassified Micromonospora]|uniref:hypothetical protein n=1 Tax=unclassified Micromonospora TaxID=2617518 RepID=UPI003318D52A
MADTGNGDQRRWWRVAASNVGRSHLYEAPNQRAAIAAFRRDLSEAERTNGRSRRETDLWLRANDFTAQGPLTTAQAFAIDFRWELAAAIDRWSPLQHDPDSGVTEEHAQRYGLSDERIERIRQQVATKYTQASAVEAKP